jgi:hypothetical protein
VLDVVDVISMGRLASACLKRRTGVSWFVMLRPLPPAMSLDATQPIAVCG